MSGHGTRALPAAKCSLTFTAGYDRGAGVRLPASLHPPLIELHRKPDRAALTEKTRSVGDVCGIRSQVCRRVCLNPPRAAVLVELEVALEPAGVDLAPVDGVLDGAVGLVGVRAVGELAEGDVGAELDEVALELAGLDAPELELAEARGVDDVAARVRAGSARRWWSCASP